MSLTVRELRELLKDLPSDALVLQDDPYSEFSFGIKGAGKQFSKVNHISKIEDEVYYDSWTEDNFSDLLSDNSEDTEKLKQEYKPSLVLYLG